VSQATHWLSWFFRQTAPNTTSIQYSSGTPPSASPSLLFINYKLYTPRTTRECRGLKKEATDATELEAE